MVCANSKICVPESNENNDLQISESDEDDSDDIKFKEIEMQNRIEEYIKKLYTLGLPESTINTIVRANTDLIYPLLNDLTACSNLDKQLCLINQFKYPLENQLSKYLRDKKIYELVVQPLRKSHGLRLDSKYDGEKQHYKQVITPCTFSYVPLLETLKFIFKFSAATKYLIHPLKSNNKDYTHFIDGEVYKNHPFFKENENAIQLQIYFDEFEVCNPLGSRSGIHKIGAFYFTILNFPSYVNSNLNNIHLLALCYNLDIKEFGINSILDVIMNDIKILETKGIFIESLNSVVKGTLVSLSFDNLGGAMLLGMNESFSSTNYCRICLLPKTEAQCTYDVENYKLRTSESFKYLARRLHCANSGTLNFFGIKNFSPFCGLKNFKICENYSIDVMHDFLEGIGQRDVKLFLSYCIESKLTSLEDINNRIHAFDYGLENRPNKPSSIKLNKSSNGIGQHAAQTLYLIKEHHKILIEEYSVNLTPKDHLALHYPLIISKTGPPKIQWTMRYESKNGFFTSLAEKLKNFKDIAQTLSNRHQKTLLSY
ncbi:uncharacterized protein LOC130672830 [Microplitis mediator]|uniref:uncharacterized protein LOC130672830 n=1 Tax=Microplitis mediator TaxID=375433 RepID=UPI0025577992|nr:uncharacterized protein LOC130672830 [Microplitis mediator]